MISKQKDYIARHVRFHEQFFPFLHQSTATSTNTQPDPYVSSFPISCISQPSDHHSQTEPITSPYHDTTEHPLSTPNQPFNTPYLQPVPPNPTGQPNQPLSVLNPPAHDPHTSPAHNPNPPDPSAQTIPVPQSTSAQPPPSTSTQLPQPIPTATPTSIPAVTSTRPAHLRQNPPKTKRYDPSAFHTTTGPHEPTTFTVANKDPQWQQAMSEEYRALMKNGTWTLVPPVSNANVVDCKWVYKLKRDQHGAIKRYKARLVAKGFNQQAGVDYHETFSPVVKPTTIRVVLSLAVARGWSLRQLDVQNAFLHGDLKETVYLRQPPGFVDPARPDHVCLLHKSLYGLKQAPRAWFQRLSKALCLLGFRGSTTDPSLFIYSSAGTFLYMLVYVDDIILTGNNPTAVDHVVNNLSSTFALQDMGPLSYFLGIEVKSSGQDLVLSQKKYILELLQKAGLSQSKPVSSPCSTKAPLTLGDSPSFDNPVRYRQVVGALQYLTLTRPDIAFAVNKVCQFMHSPTENHWTAVKRILRYLRGKNLKIDHQIRV